MATKKPNILIIWGDDIGWFNISAYNHGMMGYRTPNIDRIVKEGAMFTDWYGQQSCTAGRAAFITGQSPIRTGLTKVGLPGSKLGLQPEDPTIAELLKPQGYVCGQFGKNHLGDRDEFLPTVHGFDEFFGNLYHLNAEEEPECEDYPKGADFAKRFGPRGVLHCFASPDGTQRIEDTGHLTKKRMETMDEEITAGALGFIEAQAKADKPFFCWYNSTKMHIWTHLKDGVKGKTGLGVYPDGMVEHDRQVGQLLDKLDELKIADNTIVMYSTDNGAEELSWPDGGATPFRGEKDTNWEGGWRVPCAIRWPGVVKPGTVSNEVFSHQDMLPTLLAAAGEPDIVEKCKKGYTAGKMTYKVHLDGFNLIPHLKGEVKESPRPGFLYLERRGRPNGAPLRPLEDPLHGAARRRSRRLAGSVHAAAVPEAHQPAHRSVRGSAHLEPVLLEVARRSCLHAGARRRPRRPVHADDDGVPAPAAAGELERRQCDGEADAPQGGARIRFGCRRQVVSSAGWQTAGASGDCACCFFSAEPRSGILIEPE